MLQSIALKLCLQLITLVLLVLIIGVGFVVTYSNKAYTWIQRKRGIIPPGGPTVILMSEQEAEQPKQEAEQPKQEAEQPKPEPDS